jgi:hypothetical protein
MVGNKARRDCVVSSGLRWTGRRARVHIGPGGDASPAHGAPDTMGLQSSPAEAGEGEGDEGLTKAVPAVVKRRGSEEEWRWLQLGASMEGCGREVRNEGKRCGGGRC